MPKWRVPLPKTPSFLEEIFHSQHYDQIRESQLPFLKMELWEGGGGGVGWTMSVQSPFINEQLVLAVKNFRSHIIAKSEEVNH